MSSLLSWKWENWKQIALSQMWLFYIDTSCYFLFLLMSSAEKRRKNRIFFCTCCVFWRYMFKKTKIFKIQISKFLVLLSCRSFYFSHIFSKSQISFMFPLLLIFSLLSLIFFILKHMYEMNKSSSRIIRPCSSRAVKY